MADNKKSPTPPKDVTVRPATTRKIQENSKSKKTQTDKKSKG
ncbi:MAG: hypothetical protein Q9M36_05595 [Sulfurovum sp.]|nr:hypothetical protein [Sulfurovum sp.]